jgi:Leucine-rich repeat (LRR) protein
MEPSSNSSFPFTISNSPIGYASNGGTQRYLIEAESTTDFTAWKLADGTILINPSNEVSLPASPYVSFWSCASYTDSTPAGHIYSFDCHANALTQLNISGLTRLRYLDCCYNQISELDVSALAELEVLDSDNNKLKNLDVGHLHSLRILNCANNQLTKLDLSGLSALQVLDYAKNPLSSLDLNGCSGLRNP